MITELCKGVAVAAAIVALGSCAQVQRVQDPVQDVVRRGSCISIDIPPITLTPSRTAAERQLIGDQRELEEDGWLIASVLSEERFREMELRGDSEELRRTRDYFREMGVVTYYDEMVSSFKMRGVIGENNQNRLALLPPSIRRSTSAEELEIARRIISEVNLSRQRIDEYERQHRDGTTSPYMRPPLPDEWREERGRGWQRSGS